MAAIDSAPVQSGLLAPVGATSLSTPGLIRPAFTAVMPKDGSNFGAQVNAATLAAQNHGFTRIELSEGWFTAETPIQMRSNLYFEGPREMNDNQSAWSGGLQIDQPATGGDVVQAAGTNSDGATTLNGFVKNWGIKNVKMVARQSAALAMSQGPSTLLKIINGYRHGVYACSFVGPWVRHLLVQASWDSSLDILSSAYGGYSDRAIDPTTATAAQLAALATYTGRSALTPGETNLKFSLGVPAFEFFSVSSNAANDDNTNNYRISRVHMESAPCNGIQMCFRGNAGIKNNVRDSKIECIETNAYLIWAEQQISLKFQDVWLYAGGTGSAPAQIGTMAQGTAYNTIPGKGLVGAFNCNDLRVEGEGGWQNSAAASTTQSFVFLTGCANAHIDMQVIDGLAKVRNDQYGGRILLSACKQPNKLRCKAIDGVVEPSPPTVEVRNINGKYMGSAYSGPMRSIAGATATDAANFDDRGALILSTGTAPVVATVSDLGANVELIYQQQSAAGVVTLTPASGVTLIPAGVAVSTAGIGTFMRLRSNGDGTVTVTNSTPVTPAVDPASLAIDGTGRLNAKPALAISAAALAAATAAIKAVTPPYASRILDGIPMLWSRSLGHDGLSAAGDAGGTSQNGFLAPYAMHDLRVVFANILNTANTQTLPPNPITINATLEYPDNTFTPITFNGASSVRIDPNGLLKSDNVSVSVPAGAAPKVRTCVRIAQPPIAVSAAAAASGSLASGTYYYKVVADCGGQGLSGPSAEVSAQITMAGGIVLSWTADPLSVTPVGYRIYRATAAGAEVLLDAVPAKSAHGPVTYTDTGAIAAPIAWASGGTVVAGQRLTSGGGLWLVRIGGTSGSTAPSGTTAFKDGTATLVYLGTAAPPAAQQYPYNGVVNYYPPPQQAAAGASSGTQWGGTGGDYTTTPNKSWNVGGTSFIYSPVTILGTPDAGYDQPVAVIYGDGISVGYNQLSIGVASDQGYIALALQKALIPYYHTGKTGETNATGLALDNRNRLGFAQAASDAIYELGINDVVGGASLAAVQAGAIQSWVNIRERGPRVWACTLLPYTTSTDSWATAANQTPGAAEANRAAYNSWLRAGAPVTVAGTTYTAVLAGTAGAIVAGQAGHPLAGVFDPAALIEVNGSGVLTLNGGCWKTDGNAQTYTYDGIYPRDAAVQLIYPAIATAGFVAP